MPSLRYTTTAVNKARELRHKFGAHGKIVIPRDIANRRNAPTILNTITSEALAKTLTQSLGVPVHSAAGSRSALCYLHSPDPQQIGGDFIKNMRRILTLFGNAGLPVAPGLLENNDATLGPILPVAESNYDLQTLIIINPKEWPEDWKERLEHRKAGSAQLSCAEQIQIAFGCKVYTGPRLLKKSATPPEQSAAPSSIPAEVVPAAEPPVVPTAPPKQRTKENPLDKLFPNL